MQDEITRSTREAGHQAALPFHQATLEAIVDALRAHGPMTAEQVASRIGRELHNVRSRLTELKSAGRVFTVDRRKSPRTGVSIAVWTAV